MRPSWRALAAVALLAGVAMTGSAGLPGKLAAAAQASVLVVGDSLGVGTDGALRAALPEATIEADSRNGRTSSEGLGVLRGLLGPQHDTVVFDLGTNDGNAAVSTTAANLAAAHDLAGGRCLVIATLNRPPLAGVPIDGQNAMIRQFAATRPGVALVEWHEAASSTPGALQPDGVHPTAPGYAFRGALFADAIRGCVGGGGGGGAAPPPPVGDRQASTTSRPADQRQPRPRRRPRPASPPISDRIAAAFGAWVTGDHGPLDLARRGVALASTAADSLDDIASPSGPEPVLGK